MKKPSSLFVVIAKIHFNDIFCVITITIFKSDFHFNVINFEQQERTVERVHYVDV